MAVLMSDDILFVREIPMITWDGSFMENAPAFITVGLSTEWFFPGIDITVECPEMLILAEALKDVTGLYVRYFVDADVAIRQNGDLAVDLSPYADELVVSTVRLAEIGPGEFFHSVTTPLGCFTILFYKMLASGAYEEVGMVEFTEEIKDVLFLRPCEAEFTDEFCRVNYVPKIQNMQFPPMKPDKYVFGTRAYDEAKRYWDTHEDEAPDCWSELPENRGWFDDMAINELLDMCGLEYCELTPEYREYVIRI